MRVLVLLSIIAVAFGFTTQHTGNFNQAQGCSSASSRSGKTGLSMVSFRELFLSPEDTPLQYQQRMATELAARQKNKRQQEADLWTKMAGEARLRKFSNEAAVAAARQKSAPADVAMEAKKEKEISFRAILQALYLPWLGVFFDRFK
jgi:hypothetical protein